MSPSKISDLIEKINIGLKKTDLQKLPQIEYDLIMQHLRNLYEELHALRNKRELFSEENYAGNISTPESAEPEKLLVVNTFRSNEHLLLNDAQPERESREVKKEIKSTNSLQAAKPVAEKSERRLKVSSLNDNIKSTGSLNEKLKTKGDEVHKKLASKPLKDLIDLNNRFVLLNELFKGNAEAFSSTIQHIDSLVVYDEAVSFIESQLTSNYYWEQSSPSAKLFMKLVKQKFGILQ